MRLFFPLSGDDIFISYSRRDGALYAAGLADKLTEKKLSCFIDKLGTEPNHDLPPSLKKKIKNCTVFVLVGTEKAAQSEFVKKEIAEFKQTGRTILPIDFGGNVANAIWYEEIPGLAVETEKDLEALETGDPSQNVTNFVEKSFNYTRRNQFMSRMFWGALSIILVLGGLGVGASYYAFDQIKFADEKIEEANKAEIRANEENEKARKAEENATIQEQIAKDAKTEATKQSEIAKVEKIKTEKAGKLADEKNQLALEKTKLADEKTKLADLETKRANEETQKAEQAKIETEKAKQEEVIAKAKADKQQKIGNALQMANNSQTLLKREPERILESVSFAKDSMKILNDLGINLPESDTALRESLNLFPSFQHKNSISDKSISTALSPDGKYLVSLSKENQLIINIYDTNNTESKIDSIPLELSEMPTEVYVAINDNVKEKKPQYVLLAMGRQVLMFDLENKQNIRKFEDPNEDDSITGLAISKDGKYIAVLLDNSDSEDQIKTVGLWETDKNTAMIEFGSLTMPMECLGFDATGYYLIVGGRKFTTGDQTGAVLIWEIPSYKEEQLSKDDFNSPEEIVLDEESIPIAIQSNDVYATVSGSLISVWKRDGLSGKFICVTRIPVKDDFENSIKNIAFSSDGNQLIIERGNQSEDKTYFQSELEAWNSKGFQEVFLYGEANNIAFRPDGNSVISNIEYPPQDVDNPPQDKKPETQIWQINNESMKNASGIYYIEKYYQSQDLRYLIGTENGVLWVWDMWNSKKTRVDLSNLVELSVNTITTISADGSKLILSCDDKNSTKKITSIYTLYNDSYILKNDIKLKSEPISLKLGEVNNVIVVLYKDNTIQILDLTTQRDQTPSTMDHLTNISSITISPRGNYLLAESYGNSNLWKISNGQKIIPNLPDNEYAGQFRFDNNEQYLTTTSNTNQITIYDLEKRKTFPISIDRIKPFSSVTSVEFSPKGKYVAAGCSDGTLSIIEIGSKNVRLRLQNSGEITNIAFDPSNKYLAMTIEEKDKYKLRKDSHVLKVILLQSKDLIKEAENRLNASSK